MPLGRREELESEALRKSGGGRGPEPRARAQLTLRGGGKAGRGWLEACRFGAGRFCCRPPVLVFTVKEEAGSFSNEERGGGGQLRAKILSSPKWQDAEEGDGMALGLGGLQCSPEVPVSREMGRQCNECLGPGPGGPSYWNFSTTQLSISLLVISQYPSEADEHPENCLLHQPFLLPPRAGGRTGQPLLSLRPPRLERPGTSLESVVACVSVRQHVGADTSVPDLPQGSPNRCLEQRGRCSSRNQTNSLKTHPYTPLL